MVLVEFVLEGGLLRRGATVLLEDCDVRFPARKALHVSKSNGDILDLEDGGARLCRKGGLAKVKVDRQRGDGLSGAGQDSIGVYLGLRCSRVVLLASQSACENGS